MLPEAKLHTKAEQQSRAYNGKQFGKIRLVRWRERRTVMQHICRTEGKSL